MKGNRIFKAAFIVMIVTIASRFLGIARDMLVANNFGSGIFTDAYKVAVSVPDTIFAIIGLAISTVFIPMLSKVKHEKGKVEMFRFANNIISILFVISMLFLALGLTFTEDIVQVLVDYSGERLELTVFLTKITLINIMFLAVNACYTAILQVEEDFVIPSILGLFFNAPIIIYLILFKDISIVGLTIANVIGNALRVVVQIPSLYKQGYRIRPFIDLKDDKIKRMFILIIPVVLGAGANSLNMIVDIRIASSLVAGSVSALDYAQKIIVFANTAIATSIVSIMYPLMANKLNCGDRKGFLEYLSKSIVIIALILIPVAVGFVILNEEIITIFYKRGEFNDIAVKITSLAFLGYALSIPFVGVRDILNSSLFSMEKTKLTAINGAIGVFVNITLSLLLYRRFGVLGISIASTIASMVTVILLFISTVRLVGEFKAFDMVIKLFKIAFSALIMFFTVSVVNNILGEQSPLIFIIIDGIVGAVVYFSFCLILKIEELQEVKNIIINKISVKK